MTEPEKPSKLPSEEIAKIDYLVTRMGRFMDEMACAKKATKVKACPKCKKTKEFMERTRYLILLHGGTFKEGLCEDYCPFCGEDLL